MGIDATDGAPSSVAVTAAELLGLQLGGFSAAFGGGARRARGAISGERGHPPPGRQLQAQQATAGGRSVSRCGEPRRTPPSHSSQLPHSTPPVEPPTQHSAVQNDPSRHSSGSGARPCRRLLADGRGTLAPVARVRLAGRPEGGRSSPSRYGPGSRRRPPQASVPDIAGSTLDHAVIPSLAAVPAPHRWGQVGRAG